MHPHGNPPTQRKTSRLPWLAAAAACLSPALATASWPEDVILSGLAEHSGAVQLDTSVLKVLLSVVVMLALRLLPANRSAGLDRVACLKELWACQLQIAKLDAFLG